MPTYNFLLLELSYEYQNRKIIVVFCVNFCFLMLSFWGFLILLFPFCFFLHFAYTIYILNISALQTISKISRRRS